MILSETYANNYLSFLLGKTKTLTAPNEVWAALSTTNTETEAFSEVSGNGYGRVLIALNGEPYPAELGAASGREITNVQQIVFPKATGAYTVKGIGFFSAKSGGTPFAWGALTGGDVSVAAGALPMFEIGAFSVFMHDGSEASA